MTRNEELLNEALRLIRLSDERRAEAAKLEEQIKALAAKRDALDREIARSNTLLGKVWRDAGY